MRQLSSIALLLAAMATPATAQQMCMDGPTFFERAAKQFGEHMTSFGISGDGKSRLIVLTSKQGGWTLASLSAIGVVCIMAAGTDWQDAPLPAKKGNDL